jgi:hypothetical protein
MTFDEELVEAKIKLIVSDIMFNKITDYKPLQKDKSKIWPIVSQTDLFELLEHDDCPNSNFIALLRMAIEEIKKPNTNWKILDQLAESLK